MVVKKLLINKDNKYKKGTCFNGQFYSDQNLLKNQLSFYDLEETIKRLKVEELYNQVLFHTEKSLKYLNFIGMEER